jgi:hypothetical protein
MRDHFPKVYRSFEDFEREELKRPSGSFSANVEDMLDEMFAGELELDFEPKGRRRTTEDDED